MSNKVMKTSRFDLKSVSLFIYVILLVVLFFSTQTYFGTNNYNRIYIIEIIFIIVYIVFLIALNHGVVIYNRKEMKVYSVFLFPYLGMFFVSAVECFVLNKITISIMFRYSLQPLLICFMAVLTYSIFKKKSIKAIFVASVINYSVYIVTCMAKYGVLSVFGAGSDNDASKLLEVHEITFVFGFLAVYFWITKSGAFKLQEKHQKLSLVVTIIMSLLGFKRILIAVMIIAIILNFFLKKQKTSKMLKIATIVIVIMCFAWCFFCSSAVLFEGLSMQFGIDLKGRNWIYANFYPYYEFAVTYIGGGIGYVQSLIGNMKNMYLLGHFIGLHNEILRLYIDLGFIPYLLYLIGIFPAAVQLILKYQGYRSAVCYFVFWIFTVLCSTTDNLLTYPNYMLVFITIAIHCIFEEQCKFNEGGKNENSDSNGL